MKTIPKVVPPRSRVRLVKADRHPPAWRKHLGRRFRIGYYSRKDGLDCIWLVNEDGKYEQTTDREFLLRYFVIERLSGEKNFYGVGKRRLTKLRTSRIRRPRSFHAIPPLAAAAPRLRAIPCLIHWPFLDRLVGCDTFAAVRHTTSPILGQHSPKQFACSPVPLVRGSPSGAAAPGRCDASPGSAARDRCAPAVPVFAHLADHLCAGSW